MGSKGWLFGILALAVLGGMHRLLWTHFARRTRLPKRWRVGVAIALGIGTVLVAVSFVLGRKLGTAWPAWLARATWLWMAFVFYAWVAFVAYGLGEAIWSLGRRFARGRARGTAAAGAPDGGARGAHAAESSAFDSAARGSGAAHTHAELAAAARNPGQGPAESVADPSRRLFLARAVAGGVGVASTAIVIGGHRRALADPDTPEIELPLAGLPRELEGTRVVQISDLHLGPQYGAEECALTVERINRQRPDLVVLTGDIVDAPAAVLKSAVAPLAMLRARHGVLYVTGNHEYYSGAEDWLVELRKLGLRTLMNERVAIGDAGASFDVVGLPDESAGQFKGSLVPNLVTALRGRDRERALLGLVHRPTQAQELVRAGAGAALCGHTHGGQMWPFGGLVALVQPFLHGLHREGDGLVYVSRGAGFWGPPVRVLAPPELPCFVLTRRA